MNLRRYLIGLVVLLAAGVAALIATLVVAPFGTSSSGGNDVSETRSVSGFDRIRLEGAFTTSITAGVPRTRVVVSGTQDAVARVTAEVQGDTLVVGQRSGFDPFGRPPKVEISLPALRGLANSGTGSTNISGLTGSDIEIENAGAGSIVASGTAGREDVSLNGVGKIDTTELDAHDVTVDSNGVGAVHVRANGSLKMNLNGVGEVRYAGTPSHVESQVSGIGKIGRL